MVDVIEARAIVDAIVLGRVPASDQLGEEGVAPARTVGNASEARVLPRDAHAGMAQHEYEEARLALREANIHHGVNALLLRHRQSSSARPPLRQPRPPPPDLPVRRRLTPR